MTDAFGNPLSPQPPKEGAVVVTPTTLRSSGWLAEVETQTLFKFQVHVYKSRAITNVTLPSDWDSEVRPAALAYIADYVGRANAYNPKYMKAIAASEEYKNKMQTTGSEYPKPLIFQPEHYRARTLKGGVKQEPKENPRWQDPAQRLWSTVSPDGGAHAAGIRTHACAARRSSAHGACRARRYGARQPLRHGRRGDVRGQEARRRR